MDCYRNRWVSAGDKPNAALIPVSASEFNATTNRMVTPSVYDAAGNLRNNKVSQTAAYNWEKEASASVSRPIAAM